MTNVAVVVGGSIGGLLASLAIAEVCDEVVLVERGELPPPVWLKMRIANAYLPHVVARAQHDVQVATALLEVMQFLAPPTTLFAPGMMLRLTRK